MVENQDTFTAKDFKSDQEVRWCPGCGDHAIMNAIQRALPQLGYKKENFAFRYWLFIPISLLYEYIWIS